MIKGRVVYKHIDRGKKVSGEETPNALWVHWSVTNGGFNDSLKDIAFTRLACNYSLKAPYVTSQQNIDVIYTLSSNMFIHSPKTPSVQQP